MRRFQIDFAVRELDVPEEQARGVRFSEAVNVDNVFDFLTRVRDAVVTLVGGPRAGGSRPPPTPSAPPPPVPGVPRRRQPEVDRPWSRPIEPWVHRPDQAGPRWDDVGERIRRSWGVLQRPH